MPLKDQLFPLVDNPKSPLWEDKHGAAPSCVGHQGAQCERNRSCPQSGSCGEVFIWSLSLGFMEVIRRAGKWGGGQRDVVLFLDMTTKVSKTAAWLSERAKQLIVNREEWCYKQLGVFWKDNTAALRLVSRRFWKTELSASPGNLKNFLKNTGTSCTSVQSGPTSARKTCTLASELGCLMTWTDWKTRQTSPSD